MRVTKDIGLFSDQEWTRVTGHLGLPPRQAEILRCVMGGMSDRQVAHTIGISVNTVRTHMSRLFRKFDSNDRVELIIRMFGYLRDHPPLGGPASAPAETPAVVCPSAQKHHA